MKIIVGQTEYTDTQNKIHLITDEEGESFIECCGKGIDFVLHGDSDDHFTNVYRCACCGNEILEHVKRTEEDRKWWM